MSVVTANVDGSLDLVMMVFAICSALRPIGNPDQDNDELITAGSSIRSPRRALRSNILAT